mmetsp:Transcript_3424/g.5278  ORF Transcript_3424/g.5278 Transcript_3424/m.5278 type:complete len:443 (-) Transcript_3424:286-1614(-)
MTEVKSFYNEHCIYLPAFLGWFVFSALLSCYNKVVFGNDKLDFPCPLLLTSIHFLVQWAFAYLATEFCCPVLLGGDDVARMEWRPYLSTSVPCGIVTALDVGLSNLSLVRISLAFYTMVKASSPVFVLASAYIFGIEKITPSLLLVVLLISIGEFLTVLGEVEFDSLGFALCIGASVCSGMRWTIVQLKLHTLQPPLKSTLATMRLLAPSMFLFMFLLSLFIEHPWDKLAHKHYFDTTQTSLQTLGLGLGGAVLAITMIMFEFYLIMKSSAIVLMIGGVIKEMVTILVGVTVFGDALDPQNIAGCIVVFCGVLGYKISHHLAKLEQKYAQSKSTGAHDEEKLVLSNDFENDNEDDLYHNEEKKYDYSSSEKTHDDEYLDLKHDESESFELTNRMIDGGNSHDFDYEEEEEDIGTSWNAIHRLKMDLENDDTIQSTTSSPGVV